MKDEKTIRDIALFIIDGHTILEAADQFHISERTVQNYIKELNKKESKFYNQNLYDRVRLAQDRLRLQKAIEGGKIGKRGPSNSEFDLEEIARVMIEERLSLSEASAYFNVPISTIHDGLKRLDDEELQKELEILFDENRTLNHFNGAGRGK